nr:PilZ domain-containing protein [Yersinia frederiksenii]ULG20182.1 cellulose synthase catalytic subunit [Yersinia frederiksenii]
MALGHGPSTEIMTVIISLVWVIYNMTILGGAVAVAVEAKQVRQSHRVEIAMPAAVARADGHLFSCTLLDYSDGGVGIEMREAGLLKDGEAVQLLLKRGAQEYTFPCEVTRAFGTKSWDADASTDGGTNILILYSVPLPVLTHGRYGRMASQKINRLRACAMCWRSVLEVMSVWPAMPHR